MVDSILQQILYFFGRGFCHQIPERSFEAGGLYFAVCSRDTGIYLGFIFTLIIFLILNVRSKHKPAAMPPAWVVVMSVLLVAPMALDGVSSYLGLRETDNLIRYATGYLCGTGIAVLASGGMFNLFLRVDHEKSVADKPGRVLALLAVSGLAGVLYYLGYSSLGVTAPFMALLAQWLAVMMVNVFVVSSTRFWQTNVSIKRRVAIIFCCFAAAGLEMALFSLIVGGLGLLMPWYAHP